MCGYILCGIVRDIFPGRLSSRLFDWTDEFHATHWEHSHRQFYLNNNAILNKHQKPFHCQSEKNCAPLLPQDTIVKCAFWAVCIFALISVGWRAGCAFAMDINGENYTARNCFFNSFAVNLHSHLHEGTKYTWMRPSFTMLRSAICESNCFSVNAITTRTGWHHDNKMNVPLCAKKDA